MLKNLFYNHDWILTTLILAILTIGITTIFSTSIGSSQNNFDKQIIFSIIGFFIYLGISVVDYTYFRYKPILLGLYCFTMFLLLLSVVVGSNVRGAVRWLQVGLINIQPSELSKFILIFSLSSFFSSIKSDSNLDKLKSLFIYFPLAILVLIEPSLSSTIVLTMIWASLFFFQGNDQVKKLLSVLFIILAINLGSRTFMPSLFYLPTIFHISLGIVVIILAMGISLIALKILKFKMICLLLIVGIFIGTSTQLVWNHVLYGYQKERIIVFLSLNNTPAETQKLSKTTQNRIAAGKFQLDQSKIAIGSGSLFGKGFAQGTQSKLKFLPDHDTDFIFASFSEEFGLVGDIILLALFCGLFFRIIQVAEKVTDRFGFFVLIAIVTMLAFQTFINIGINIGLLPSTGMPMPLISYGGSSLWITLILLGFVQSIYRRTSEKKWLNIEI